MLAYATQFARPFGGLVLLVLAAVVLGAAPAVPPATASAARTCESDGAPVAAFAPPAADAQVSRRSLEATVGESFSIILGTGRGWSFRLAQPVEERMLQRVEPPRPATPAVASGRFLTISTFAWAFEPQCPGTTEIVIQYHGPQGPLPSYIIYNVTVH